MGVSTLPAPTITEHEAPHARLLRLLALANLVANTVIVGTGAAVRLTKSGLGCPTWPECTEDSYVNTPELGVHGWIEFGNRQLTFVLAAIVLAVVVAAVKARPPRPRVRAMAVAVGVGVCAQAILGGITVRMELNPWTVSAHFLLSTALIYLSYALWMSTTEGDGPRVFTVPAPLVWLARALAAAAAAVLVVGTVVTGSGPHSGDSAAARTGFDPELVSQLHVDAVFLLVGLTIAAWFAFRATGRADLTAAVAVLLVVELAQGGIGFVQYAMNLPVLAVELHVIGACLVWIAALRVLFGVRVRH